MSTRTMTLLFMAVIFLIIAIYDSIMATNRPKGDTISEIALWWSFGARWAFIVFLLALGGLLGHLFWPQVVYIEKQ